MASFSVKLGGDHPAIPVYEDASALRGMMDKDPDAFFSTPFLVKGVDLGPAEDRLAKTMDRWVAALPSNRVLHDSQKVIAPLTPPMGFDAAVALFETYVPEASRVRPSNAGFTSYMEGARLYGHAQAAGCTKTKRTSEIKARNTTQTQ
eukprot:15477258-Alexandrium_andersonii.AAC.1